MPGVEPINREYAPRRLRAGAFEYARGMLGLGRSVGKALEAFLRSDVAEAWTLAPPGLSDDRLNAYRGRTPGTTPDQPPARSAS